MFLQNETARQIDTITPTASCYSIFFFLGGGGLKHQIVITLTQTILKKGEIQLNSLPSFVLIILWIYCSMFMLTMVFNDISLTISVFKLSIISQQSQSSH